MKFSQLKYKRPDVDELRGKIESLTNEFKSKKNSKDQIEIIYKVNNLRSSFETMACLAEIRHTQDTRDEFYDKENDFFDNNNPVYEEIVTEFYKTMLGSESIGELKEEIGTHFFNLAEMQLKAFSPEIVEDLKIENSLSSKYGKLMASAKIPFQNNEYNLSEIVAFHQDSDRKVREESLKARFNFYSDNSKEIDDIYDKLVKVRTKIANKLGFENFIPLGYLRMFRSDYTAKDVQSFRESIVENIVPLSEEIYSRQWKRLGIENPKVWDKEYIFPTGNPKPKGDKEWMVAQAADLYRKLSPETEEFFNFMVENELLDLEARKGKAGGGYCEALPDFKMPFIFSNFNGTSGDVDVLTHEAGHAFQVYSTLKKDRLIELMWPTYECCEVHSMSMEFFAWPLIENFFKEDGDKYRYGHLGAALTFVPYGCAVDEFQHMVYENPESTPEERHDFWAECEKKYNPSLNNGGIDFLEKGGFWQKQPHIFSSPFYYIDYVLAQMCALQYWRWDREDHKEAWSSYLELCKVGGENSFLKLLEGAGLNNPFKNEVIKEVSKEAKAFLNSVDDSKF